MENKALKEIMKNIKVLKSVLPLEIVCSFDLFFSYTCISQLSFCWFSYLCFAHQSSHSLYINKNVSAITILLDIFIIFQKISQVKINQN